MARFFAWLHYRFDLLRWHMFDDPFRYGDPFMGTGEQRKKNIHLCVARWLTRKPKAWQYGLKKRDGD